MTIIRKIKQIIKSKHPHFIYVDYNLYKKWKFLLILFTLINRNYKSVEIFRKKYKYHKKIVVIALRYYGRNVKRRTNGFAKDFVRNNPDSECIYCNTKLTLENATADHIIPVSKGSNNSKVNLIVCCEDCNGERGDTEFYEYLHKKNSKWNSDDKFI